MEHDPCLYDLDWRAILFGSSAVSQGGNKLGISYVRSLQPLLEVKVGENLTISVKQGSQQEIPFVVWDAGLLLVDYICAAYKTQNIEIERTNKNDGSNKRCYLGNTLDIGCGSGVCGIAALALGAPFVLFTDACLSPHLHENICTVLCKGRGMPNSHSDDSTGSSSNAISTDGSDSDRNRAAFVEYDWTDANVPKELFIPSLPPPISTPQQNVEGTTVFVVATSDAAINPLPLIAAATETTASSMSNSSSNSSSTDICSDKSCSVVWDTVICSDLLYFAAMHKPLLKFLKRLRFKRAIFSYKKRHPVDEMMFFADLEQFCSLSVLRLDTLRLVNLKTTSLSGLFIIIAEPFEEKES